MNAEQIAASIYHTLGLETQADLTDDPTGRHGIALANGWTLWLVDDPGPDAPNGVSWWLDSPTERLIESGGWNEPEEDAAFHGEFGKLAEWLDYIAATGTMHKPVRG